MKSGTVRIASHAFKGKRKTLITIKMRMNMKMTKKLTYKSTKKTSRCKKLSKL